MSVPILFNSIKECCGCESCVNVCPKDAISMELNQSGFYYPKIDDQKCINCGSCKMVCDFQNNIVVKHNPIRVFAAQSKNTDLFKSASGGVFASIAKHFISGGGIVFGVGFDHFDGKIRCVYRKACDLSELDGLLGSKYVHANIGNVYSEIKNLLNSGYKVLFSGSPCQVASLKCFLRKEYDNLYLIDIICHGVPESKWFEDYIDILEKKNDIKILEYVFRDKKNGWGLRGRYDYLNKRGACKSKFFISRESSYYYYFLTGNNYRMNCYNCKYASNDRVSDLTIGDFWGIESEHYKEINENGFDVSLGVSCILVCTSKGQALIDEHGSGLNVIESEMKKVAKHNEQLNRPFSIGSERKHLEDLYIDNGYAGVEDYFKEKIGISVYSYKFKDIIRHLFRSHM